MAGKTRRIGFFRIVDRWIWRVGRPRKIVCASLGLPTENKPAPGRVRDDIVSATCVVVLGMNVSSAYQSMKLQRDVTGSWTDVATLTYDSTTGVAYAFFTSVSSDSWRVVVRDWENSDGYLEFGTAIIGDYYTISKWFQHGFSEDVEDTSTRNYSKQGYVNVVVGYFRDTVGVTYEVLETDEGYLEDMYRDVGTRYPFVFVRDSEDVLDTLSYVMFAGKFSRRGKDDYTKEITLAWVGVK